MNLGAAQDEKGNGKSGSFAALRMTRFVGVLAVGSCLDRAGHDFGPPKAQKQERTVGGAASFTPRGRGNAGDRLEETSSLRRGFGLQQLGKCRTGG